MAVGLPLGYWLAYSRWRGKFSSRRSFHCQSFCRRQCWGFMFWLRSVRSVRLVAGISRYRVEPGIHLQWIGSGSVLYSLPFAVQPIAAAFSSVDRKLLDASATLGTSGWGTFWKIVLPLGFPGVLTGFVLSFAHTLGEFGVVLMIGGNIPGATQTVSILDLRPGSVAELCGRQSYCAFAVGPVFVMLTLLYGLRRKNKWVLWGWQ